MAYKKKEKTPKSVNLNIRISPQERDHIKYLASKSTLKVSEYVRQRLIDGK